jgi:aspartyl-tRNA(Asn)/glutamyl-tRNA(Gln) amidotransferase subunit A
MIISHIVKKVKSGELTAVDLVTEALAKAHKYDAEKHIFISFNDEQALKEAAEIDKKIANGEATGSLAGIPYALKDNFLKTASNATTAASKLLSNFNSPITATSVAKVDAEGAICIGRTNLDAFAHGSSTENSYFGVTKNSADNERVAGGSSGGSAVAVALGIVPFAFGSDTGGSIRQPASFNGVLGVKPTYGAVSRFGVVAMASSTDTIGCFTTNSDDAELIMSIIAGKDDKDSTTIPENIYTKTSSEIKTIGIVKDFMIDGLDPEIRQTTLDTAEKLKNLGYEVKEVSLPHAKYSLAIYYIIVPAEVASNLARFDGIRYGVREEGKDLSDLYGKTRDLGFMPENKRRILIGNYVLSSGFYDAYYLKAGKARTLLIEDFNKAFEQVDCLLAPIVPNPAFKIGEKVNDPVKMYLEDVLSVPASLAGLPEIVVPTAKTKDGLPIGVGLIGRKTEDLSLLELAQKLEAEND